MEKNVTTSSTKAKRSSYQKKLAYQGSIIEKSTSSLPASSTLDSNYLTTKYIGAISPRIMTDDSEDMEIVKVEKKRLLNCFS